MGCTGTTRKGAPCRGNALKGRDVCIAHADDVTKESLRFGGAQAGAGRPKTPRAVDVLRERIERDIEKWLKPIEDALTAERFVGFDDGEAVYAEDHATRLRAAAEGFDRAYGKPKQISEVSGPDGAAIPVTAVEVPDTEQYRQRVAEIAATTSGLALVATNGNGNGHH